MIISRNAEEQTKKKELKVTSRFGFTYFKYIVTTIYILGYFYTMFIQC